MPTESELIAYLEQYQADCTYTARLQGNGSFYQVMVFQKDGSTGFGFGVRNIENWRDDITSHLKGKDMRG